jgi:hypothetical protein
LRHASFAVNLPKYHRIKEIQVKKIHLFSIALASFALTITTDAEAFPISKKVQSARLPIIRVEAIKHKMRSAGFLKARLEKKNVIVDDVRREGQVYLFLVHDEETKAIVAVDGYSSEIIGVKVLTYPAGTDAVSVNSAGRHFSGFSYEFGYVVEQATFESYTETTTEESSSTEEYSEVSYEESKEVSYEDISYDEGSTEEDVADLDQGDEGDAAGDQEADIQDNADEAPNEGSSDDGE